MVEADEETPTTTTPTAAPEPPPVDVVIEIEPEEPIAAPDGVRADAGSGARRGVRAGTG